MAISYLASGAGASAESMNALFAEADAKLAKTFGGGKSFILAAEDFAWSRRDTSLMRLLGVPIFFCDSGSNLKYINPITMMISPPVSPDIGYPYCDALISYNEAIFDAAKQTIDPYSYVTAGDFNAFDDDRGVVKTTRVAASYWNSINYSERSNVSSFFDNSLLVHKLPNLSGLSFSDLYLESVGSGDTNPNTVLVPTGRVSITIPGSPSTLYDIPLYINGQTEAKAYQNGTADGTFYYSGNPVSSNINIWRLDVSAPSGHFYLNNGSPGSIISLSKAVRHFYVSGGATMTLSYDVVDGFQANPPNPQWARVENYPSNPVGDGYYIQEYSDRDLFLYPLAQPERTNQYGLAEVFMEGLTGITLPATGNKYDCYRVHNLNDVSGLVNIGTGYSQYITPFECRTFRKFNNGWGTGYHYFFPYESGDPRYYTTIPLQAHTTAGAMTSGIFSWNSTWNSYAANNLLSPSVLFDWIEAFSTETNPGGGETQGGASPPDVARRALLYQDIDTTPYSVGVNYSGLYQYPITDDTILGDLIHHQGRLKMAKISKTLLDANGNPEVVFDWLGFSGYSTIVGDFATKSVSVAEGANGSYVLTNTDAANDVALISVSTNLLKQGEYIPSIVDLPYELEQCVLDSSYYQDSWTRHISGQPVLFQTEQTHTISGQYKTGDLSSLLSIKCHENTVGDLKNGLGLGYSGVTGSSVFSNFAVNLTPNGLYFDFNETIPAFHQLVPIHPKNNNIFIDADGNPINWFGDLKSYREGAIPWTRLQGDWDLDGADSLTRKRRLHFRGHGFGWSNLKFDRTTLLQNNNLADLASFNTLYTGPKQGRFYLSYNASSPISGLNQGGDDFYVQDSGFVFSRGAVKLCENINPYSRELTQIGETVNSVNFPEWERFLNLKQIGSIDSLLDCNALTFSSFYHNADPLSSRYKFSGFDGTPYVPLLVEHYNAMVEKVNSCKYARPLSADQWWKERFYAETDQAVPATVTYGYKRIVPIFKTFNLGFSYDGDVNQPPATNRLSSIQSQPCKIPFDAYGVLNRVDLDFYWGNTNIDVPYDWYRWFSGNVGINIVNSNSGAILSNLAYSGSYTGTIFTGQQFPYYNAYALPSILSSGVDSSPPYPILDYNAPLYISTEYLRPPLYNNELILKNGNKSTDIYPYGSIGSLSGIHYIGVEQVNSFFTGKAQHFYWKNSCQPLKWEAIKHESAIAGSFVNLNHNMFTTGLYRNISNSLEVIADPYTNSGYGYPSIFEELSPVYLDWTNYLGTTMSLYPILETWLTPTQESPTWRATRNLQGLDRNVRENRNKAAYSSAGLNNFNYAYISGLTPYLGGGELITGAFSVTPKITSNVKRLWDLNYEHAYPTLTISSLNQFPYPYNVLNESYQVLPMGISLFSNNSNQLKWKMIGFKEEFSELDRNHTFATFEAYTGKDYQLSGYVGPDTIFQQTFTSSNTWSGCHSYIDESYGSHYLVPMHEPIIDL